MTTPQASPQPPTLPEIEQAARQLAGVVRHTPLVPLAGRPDVLLKAEIHQATGSFKIRGVFHAASQVAPERRAAGLSTVSAGNTAKALAWSARELGVGARSIMPEGAPATKVEAVRTYGGTPVLVPTAEVFRFLREHLWEDEPYAFIHPWTNRDVMIGHASLGLEILADCPDVETVYVPVGGGGLLAGVGSALRLAAPSVRIVAVEPAGCPALHASLAAGAPVSVLCDTMCDGVAVPYITDEMYPILAALADEVRLVSEEDVRATIRMLAMGNHVVVEGAGALATAAALMDAAGGGPRVALLTGGSIDARILGSILMD